ncbi:alpha/beta fold hydrolase [Acidiphilium sp.]|uniref:thioesterase domain-containing protein n=1 Tax=Acidiphilium sp. TaxID=527 RepID=UPI003D00BF6C
MPGIDLGTRPRTSTDAAMQVTPWLIGQVESLLRCGPLTPADDFFDQGGDSMSALAIFAAIEERFGCSLPLTTIYDAPTIAALVTRIIEAGSATSSCLIPIKQGDATDQPPAVVILIHGIGGHVFDLLRLGGMIETAHPVAALRAHGLEPGETPHDRVETMAEAQETLIRSRFGGRRVHLIGYSFGGLIAIELARRLSAAQTEVGAVVLLDSYPHPQCWPRAQALDVRWRRVRHQIGALRRDDWPARIDYLRRRLGWAGTGRSARAQWLAAPESATAEIRAVFEAASTAIDHYNPTSFDRPVTFIRPRCPSVFLPTNPRAVWRDTIARLDISDVPGDHVTMLDAHVDTLARTISAVITAGDRG